MVAKPRRALPPPPGVLIRANTPEETIEEVVRLLDARQGAYRDVARKARTALARTQGNCMVYALGELADELSRAVIVERVEPTRCRVGEESEP